MTPYLGRDNLDRDQHRFNYYHSESRMVIEHSFGELKARWREILLEVYATPERASDIIVTCATLHNICRCRDDKFWRDWNLTEGELHPTNRPQPVDQNDGFSAIRDRVLLEWRNRLRTQITDRTRQ